MSKLPYLNPIPRRIYDFKDKERSIGDYIDLILVRLYDMFEWKGLPEDVEGWVIDHNLFINGQTAAVEVGGTVKFLYGSFSGEPNEYYLPTNYTIANPYLPEANGTYKIGEDLVLVKNDELCTGLMPLLTKYATMMMENNITLNLTTIQSRLMSLITAKTDTSKAAGELYLKKITEGELGVIADEKFLEGIGTQPFAGSGPPIFTDLIEYQQYLWANLWIELGINATWNAKRESLNSAETMMNYSMAKPLAESMLEVRKKACEQINSMFGLEMSVEFKGVWEELEKEMELSESGLAVSNSLEAAAIEDGHEEPELMTTNDDLAAEEVEETTEEETVVEETVVEVLKDLLEVESDDKT